MANALQPASFDAPAAATDFDVAVPCIVRYDVPFENASRPTIKSKSEFLGSSNSRTHPPQYPLSVRFTKPAGTTDGQSRVIFLQEYPGGQAERVASVSWRVSDLASIQSAEDPQRWGAGLKTQPLSGCDSLVRVQVRPKQQGFVVGMGRNPQVVLFKAKDVEAFTTFKGLKDRDSFNFYFGGGSDVLGTLKKVVEELERVNAARAIGRQEWGRQPKEEDTEMPDLEDEDDEMGQISEGARRLELVERFADMEIL